MEHGCISQIKLIYVSYFFYLHTYLVPLFLCLMSEAQQMTNTMCSSDLNQESATLSEGDS